MIFHISLYFVKTDFSQETNCHMKDYAHKNIQRENDIRKKEYTKFCKTNRLPNEQIRAQNVEVHIKSDIAKSLGVFECAVKNQFC